MSLKELETPRLEQVANLFSLYTKTTCTTYKAIGYWIMLDLEIKKLWS